MESKKDVPQIAIIYPKVLHMIDFFYIHIDFIENGYVKHSHHIYFCNDCIAKSLEI